jgi:hypothetical protein
MANGQISAPSPLTITEKSYCRGVLDGNACVVVYNSNTDETTVIAKQSRWYRNAMAALEVLEAASVPIPAAPKKTIIHARRIEAGRFDA